jgi:hypothetical protein
MEDRTIETAVMADEDYTIATSNGTTVVFRAGQRYRMEIPYGEPAAAVFLLHGHHRYLVEHRYIRLLERIPASQAHTIRARPVPVFVSLCELGPIEVARLGPFDSVELGRVGILMAQNGEDWQDIEVSQYAHVFIEAGSED